MQFFQNLDSFYIKVFFVNGDDDDDNDDDELFCRMVDR